MSIRDKNILVVGQGVAGSILSFKLWQRKIKHKVVDDNHNSSATLAAAGIINPITGRRYAKSWMIDDLLPHAIQTYSDISDLLGYNYLIQRNIIRCLKNPAQENKWHSSYENPISENYHVESPNLGGYASIISKPLSIGEIKNSYQVNIRKFIIDYRAFLKSENNLIEAKLNYSDVNEENEKVKLFNEAFDLVIFCEGYKGRTNPYFDKVEFQSAKGQSLIIDVGQPTPEKIIKDDIFLAPSGRTSFWTGGTYDWTFENGEITDTFLNLWKTKLKKLLLIDYKIIDHRAGIRPTVIDRRPLLGRSTQMPSLFIFNGMGTKGTSLAPYWADALIEHLHSQKPLHKEVDISRFSK